MSHENMVYDIIMTILAIIAFTVFILTLLAILFWPLALIYFFGFNYPLLCAQLFWLVILGIRQEA